MTVAAGAASDGVVVVAAVAADVSVAGQTRRRDSGPVVTSASAAPTVVESAIAVADCAVADVGDGVAADVVAGVAVGCAEL